MQEDEKHIVDAVITWVDGNDPAHKLKMERYIGNKRTINSRSVRMRYDQVNEIEFAVKSILKYAKFIRNIFIVTDNQTPEFLQNVKEVKEFSNVYIVDHQIIFEGFEEYLPTFNSMSIESLLFKIPNLSENFIYLNDDFFLLRESNISDFFINEKPIIRGKWTSFYDDIWYKKVQKNIYKLLGKRKKINAFGFKKSQQLIVKKLGFKKYFHIDHTFTAMRKSVMEEYYTKNPKVLETNIKHRFRSQEQFVNQSLVNHLEIQNNTCVLKYDYQLLYFQSYKKPLFWLKFKLNVLSKRKDKLFLCMQSLDQAPEDKQKFILDWLDNKYQ